MFICRENWLKYLPWVPSLLSCSLIVRRHSFPRSARHPLIVRRHSFPHSARHPPLDYSGLLFPPRGSCLEMILEFGQWKCGNCEVLLSGSSAGTANAERMASGPPFRLWARMHLAEAITKAFMPRRNKASKDHSEICGNVRSRDGKPGCHGSFEI